MWSCESMKNIVNNDDDCTKVLKYIQENSSFSSYVMIERHFISNNVYLCTKYKNCSFFY